MKQTRRPPLPVQCTARRSRVWKDRIENSALTRENKPVETLTGSSVALVARGILRLCNARRVRTAAERSTATPKT